MKKIVLFLSLALSTAVLFAQSGTRVFYEDFNNATPHYRVGYASGNGYQTAAYSRWNRVADTTPAAIAQAASDMPVSFDANNIYSIVYLNNGSLVGIFESPSGGGFMAMSMQDQIGSCGGTNTMAKFDSWMAFKSVTTTSGKMYDVSFYQYYKTFNQDSCFLEYSSDSINWNSIHINRRGLEMSPNEQTKGIKTVNLPYSVCNYTNLFLRLRWKSDTVIGGAYGYYWLVDDFSIYEISTPNRLNVLSSQIYDGGYHLVPQGMGGNDLLLVTNFRNNGINTQTNIYSKILNSSGNVIAQSQQIASLPADPLFDTFAYIDPHGRKGNYFTGCSDTFGTSNPLPWVNAGYDSVIITLSSDSNLYYLDTIPFYVNCDYNGNRIWGRDNGILRGYSFWDPPLDMNPIQNNDPLGGFVMYNTPDTVPQGWVIRGIEIVPSTRVGYVLPGSIINPKLYIDSVSNSAIYYISQNIGTPSYTIQQTDINTFITGYQTFGTYPTIRIPFPNQPALQPNTRYYIGYEKSVGSTFSPAVGASFYYDNDSIPRPLPGLLGHSFGMGSIYSVIAYDNRNNPNVPFRIFLTDATEIPMIRMIVGPRMQTTFRTVTWTAFPAGNALIYENSTGNDITGITMSYPLGSTVVFSIVPQPNCVIDSIVLNGLSIDMLNDPNLTFGQGYYTYILHLQFKKDLEGFNDDMECSVYARNIGGDIITTTDNAVVKLQPNPASTSANLTIEGVRGNVEYSLIDINGRTIFNKTINANTTEQINLEGLTRGTYFVRVTNSTFTKVEKLIVK